MTINDNGVTFEAGDTVIWINANNIAFRGKVMRPEYDDDGRTRVPIAYLNERGVMINAAPFKERVGYANVRFDPKPEEK